MTSYKNLLFILGAIAIVCVFLAWTAYFGGDDEHALKLFTVAMLACAPIIFEGISSGGWQALNPFSGSK